MFLSQIREKTEIQNVRNLKIKTATSTIVEIYGRNERTTKQDDKRKRRGKKKNVGRDFKAALKVTE